CLTSTTYDHTRPFSVDHDHGTHGCDLDVHATVAGPFKLLFQEFIYPCSSETLDDKILFYQNLRLPQNYLNVCCWCVEWCCSSKGPRYPAPYHRSSVAGYVDYP